jgi:1,4-dihydroxy-2-naphthoate octaprenyltransferase
MADTQWEVPHYLFSINRFFFIYAICILFDLRDPESDKKEGITILITYFNIRQIDVLFWWVLVVFFITTAWLSFYVAVGVTIALLLPGFVLAFYYHWFKRHRSDYVYYFILDGLMIFSLPLLLLFQF